LKPGFARQQQAQYSGAAVDMPGMRALRHAASQDPLDDLRTILCALATVAALMVLTLMADEAAAAVVEVQTSGSDGKPLSETVVFLESASAKSAVRPQGVVEIGQSKRQFERRVSVVPVGTEINFPNRDTVRHHVYSFSPAKTFELKLYSGKPANPVLFDRAGVAVLGCNIHDSMAAWVVVVETPYHAVSDASGTVRLDNVPPGSYHLRSWHPALAPGAAAGDELLQVGAGGASARVKVPVTAAAL
jgi:plastocyanin